MMKKDILSIQGVCKSFVSENGFFRNGANNDRVLNDLTLTLKQNEITAITGGNGAGKTTLFNLISGFERPDKGRVLFENCDITKKLPHRITELGIGRLFQEAHIFKKLSVMDNMLIANSGQRHENPLQSIFNYRKVKAYDLAKRERVFEIFVELLGKEHKFLSQSDRLAGEFSYGEQRLLGLARLFMQDYKLVLLDEPTSGVHEKYFEPMGRILEKMVKQKGMSILLIEHNMSFVEQVADVHIHLDGGRIKENNKRTKAYVGIG